MTMNGVVGLRYRMRYSVGLSGGGPGGPHQKFDFQTDCDCLIVSVILDVWSFYSTCQQLLAA
jgi:hypothetical protein